MKAAVATALSPSLAQRFKQRILHGYFVRIHMGLILTAVTASGLLASKGMLMAGVLSLRFRYPVAILCSYLVFLGLVRMWIWYVCRRQAAGVGSLDFANIDLTGGGGSSGGSGGGGGSFRFAGGNSGGGGASGVWEADADAGVTPPVSAPASSGGSGWSLPKIDLDLGDDGWEILLLLAALVLAMAFAGGRGAADSAGSGLAGGVRLHPDARLEARPSWLDERRAAVDRVSLHNRASARRRVRLGGAQALPASREAGGGFLLPGRVMSGPPARMHHYLSFTKAEAQNPGALHHV
jgi:hypothetical protein